MTHDEIMEAGALARRQGLPMSANPLSRDREFAAKRAAWREGWLWQQIYDGPYSAELAEAFRQGARELQIDRLDVAADAKIEEMPGRGGVFVHCRVFVADGERLPLAGEEAGA